MANMSYCRFENTSRDLRDCYENMDAENMSYDERLARWRMIRTCVKIAADYADEGTDESKPTNEEDEQIDAAIIPAAVTAR